jgi:hypothetical protein
MEVRVLSSALLREFGWNTAKKITCFLVDHASVVAIAEVL